jgi:predicted P-loop ATPase
VGYVVSRFDDVVSRFDDVVVTEDDEGVTADLPSFRRTKAGEIEATLTNIETALRSAKTAGWRIAYDEFRDEVMMATSKGKLADVKWRPMSDADYTRLRLRLEAVGFKPVGRELMRDAVAYIADEITIDSAQLWLRGLVWDGVPRVKKYLHGYFGSENTKYADAVSRYIWTALAGRVLDPGCKVDMMPILYGAQGIRKSSGIAAMAPDVSMFCELSFSEINHDNIARKMRGMLVCEFAEMDGLHGREIESTKKFVTRTHEQWVPKFKEFTTTFPRRSLFIGSTNSNELLDDITGNRRWLPIEVTDVRVDDINRDRDQLWAEGMMMFVDAGIQYDDAEKLAVLEHHAFAVTDVWDDTIFAWLKLQFDSLEGEPKLGFKLEEILHGALGIMPRDMTKAHQMRGSKSMKKLGYEKDRRYMSGHRHVVWVKNADKTA